MIGEDMQAMMSPEKEEVSERSPPAKKISNIH